MLITYHFMILFLILTLIGRGELNFSRLGLVVQSLELITIYSILYIFLQISPKHTKFIFSFLLFILYSLFCLFYSYCLVFMKIGGFIPNMDEAQRSLYLIYGDMLALIGVVSVFFIFTMVNVRLVRMAMRPVDKSFLKVILLISLATAASLMVVPRFWYSKEPFRTFLQDELVNQNINHEQDLTPEESSSKVHNTQLSNCKSGYQPYDNVIFIIIDALRYDYFEKNIDDEFIDFLGTIYKKPVAKLLKGEAACTISSCSIKSIFHSDKSPGPRTESVALQKLLNASEIRSQYLLSDKHYSDDNKFYGGSPTFYRDGNDSGVRYAADDRILFDFLTEVQFSNRNFFYFHLMSAHAIGIAEDKNGEMRRLGLKDYFKSNENFRALYKQYYINGVQQAFKTIKGLLSSLANELAMERTLVLITSDHGEYLGEGNKYGHGSKMDNILETIPFFIIGPNDDINGAIVTPSHIDIAPTVMNAFGFSSPASWDGKSLLKESIVEACR